jgi:hypothetical protein
VFWLHHRFEFFFPPVESVHFLLCKWIPSFSIVFWYQCMQVYSLNFLRY